MPHAIDATLSEPMLSPSVERRAMLVRRNSVAILLDFARSWLGLDLLVLAKSGYARVN